MSFTNGDSVGNGITSEIPYASAEHIAHSETSFINPMLLSLDSTPVPSPKPHVETPTKHIDTTRKVADMTIESLFSSDDDDDMEVDDAEETEKGLITLKPTGCCYDERMTMHASTDCSPDSPHPECPDRIRVIMRGFKQAGIVFAGSDEDYHRVMLQTPGRHMHRIKARLAIESEICTVHSVDAYKWVDNLQRKTLGELQDITLGGEGNDDRKSLYVNSMTTQAALLSAGAAIDTCKHVVEGNVKNAIAVIRPPGHHAECTESMGFCLFNNVAIAASVCQADFPESCRKVLILDWDVHHGNGTQNIFYSNESVLYISLHVYKGGNFYPGINPDPTIPDGDLHQVGANKGIGKNVNIGWHDQGMGDAEYLAAFNRIVMPMAREFDPDLVIISAGFDAAGGDQLGGCFVTPECYSQMTHMLMSLADGKVSVCLEGGYNLEALQRSALAVAKTLMGEPPARITGLDPIRPEAEEVLDKVIEYHAPYWECMQHARRSTPSLAKAVTDMSGLVRENQARYLMDTHAMLDMYMRTSELYYPMDRQILASPNIEEAEKIVLILHDPPDIVAWPDPTTRKTQPHNALLVDEVRKYVDWAVTNGFGVMDINVPFNKRPIGIEGTLSETLSNGNTDYQAIPDEDLMLPQLQELMEYLWDNYLELWPTKHIVLIGVGHSYFGVKLLLTARDAAKHKISGVANFVSGSLRPIRSSTDPALSSWYKANSRVYVDTEHACWDGGEIEKRVRKKRFGNVIKSDASELNGMMARHFDEVTAWIEECCADKEDGGSDGDEDMS